MPILLLKKIKIIEKTYEIVYKSLTLPLIKISHEIFSSTHHPFANFTS